MSHKMNFRLGKCLKDFGHCKHLIFFFEEAWILIYYTQNMKVHQKLFLCSTPFCQNTEIQFRVGRLWINRKHINWSLLLLLLLIIVIIIESLSWIHLVLVHYYKVASVAFIFIVSYVQSNLWQMWGSWKVAEK